MTAQEILAIAMRQSAADCACSEEDFRRDRNVVVESKKAEGTSRFLKVPHICALFSYGSNIVASCRADLIPEVTAFVDGYESVYRCFDTPGLYELNRILEKAGAQVDWMHNFYLPDPDLVYGAELPCLYETREMHPEDFTELYVPDWSQGVPKWSNALSHARKELDVLGVGAFDGGQLIGLAACSADCPEMWQIGIDVLPEYRQKGIASALTNRLARAILERGKVPFYAAAWANVRSVKNGLRSGFRPAWSVITAGKKEG